MTQRILITGASSGLGEALARHHAALGHALVLLARREPRLKTLSRQCRDLGAPAVIIVRGDVSQRGLLQRAVNLTQRHLGGLDVAYANAGYSQSGRIEALTLAEWRRQMAVNVEGVLNTVQLCLPLLRRSQGRLGLVGSVVGFASLSNSAAYAASKASVRALAQVLDLELQGSGVSVTHIAPGFFASEIRLKDAKGRLDPQAPEYIPKFILGDTVSVARAIAQAVQSRRREIVLPRHARIAVFIIQHFPGLAQMLARRLSVARQKRKRVVQGRSLSRV